MRDYIKNKNQNFILKHDITSKQPPFTPPPLNNIYFPDDNFQLKLKRSQNIIDKSFVFISRNQNQSEFVDDSFNAAKMYGDCLYRSENSAFDLCDHEIVSFLV